MTSPYRNPDQEREFLEQQFKSFFSEADAIEKAQADAAEKAQAAHEAAQAAEGAARAATEATNRYWGFVVQSPESLQHQQPLPADHFRFADLCKEPWV
jgi:hypothetical protein